MNEESNNTVDTTSDNQQVQTYTTDEVAQMLKEETDKRVAEALEAQKVEFEQKQAESERTGG